MPRLAVADVDITRVTERLRPGPYTTLAVAPDDPDRIAVADESGHVSFLSHGDVAATDTVAVPERMFDSMALRGEGGGFRSSLAGRGSGSRRATLLFLSLLREGYPGVRWSFWMGLSDPITTITSVGLGPAGGPNVAAGPAGVLIEADGVWTRVLGGPGPMPRKADIQGLSAAVDPTNPKRIVAGTSDGIVVSDDGGATFLPHPDPRTQGDTVIQIMWDARQPGLVFAVTPSLVLLSEDHAKTFTPGLSVGAEIRSLSLTSNAAFVSTDDGLHVALADRIAHILEGKSLIGATSVDADTIIAATSEMLYEVTSDGVKVLAKTTSKDPFLEVAGGDGVVWVLTPTDLLRLVPGTGADSRRPKAARPPKLKLSAEQLERVVEDHTGLGDPDRTRMHPRWYAKLLPRLVVQVDGWLGDDAESLRDGTFPVRVRNAQAVADDSVEWSVMAVWDLSSFVFGDTSNVTNANLLLEANLRRNRERILTEAHRRYREAAELVKQLEYEQSDPVEELMVRLRLEEHASYLEYLAGQPVVDMEEQ